MKTVALHMMGGFGNQLFQYAFARGYCERHGYRLETPAWVGQQIFEGIEDPPISMELPRLAETDIDYGAGDISLFGYFQSQKCADYYSKTKVREWFQLRSEIRKSIWVHHSEHVAAHYRCGDYLGAGYPVVSMKSISLAAMGKFATDKKIHFVSIEYPGESPILPPNMKCLHDFYVLATERILFRANSSFSWWASEIGGCKTYSPRIDGLVGGFEYDDVQFEEGNHCRLADLDFITDIHLKP